MTAKPRLNRATPRIYKSPALAAPKPLSLPYARERTISAVVRPERQQFFGQFFRPLAPTGRKLRRTRKGALALLVGAFALPLSACTCEAPSRAMLRRGEGPVEIRAMTLDDKAFDLRADLPNKVVLLNVWASWCGPCKMEMPALRKLEAKYSARGLRVVGINVDRHDQKKQALRVVAQYGLKYPNVFDPNSRYAMPLGADALPTSVLLDRESKIQWRHQGTFSFEDPRIHQVIEELLDRAPAPESSPK